METQCQRRAQQTRTSMLIGPKAQTRITAHFRQQQAQPLQAIQRPEAHQGQPAGTYTADPMEVDRIVRQAWEPVYNGNVDNMNHMVDDFFKKYHPYIHRAPTSAVQDLDWRDLKVACQHGASTAPGLDGWTKMELQWLSDLGFQWLAKCFHSIEHTTVAERHDTGTSFLPQQRSNQHW